APASPSLHRGPGVGDTGAGSRRAAHPQANRLAGRHPEPGRSASGLPIPHPVRIRNGRVSRRGPTCVRGCGWYHRALSLAHERPVARGSTARGPAMSARAEPRTDEATAGSRRLRDRLLIVALYLATRVATVVGFAVARSRHPHGPWSATFGLLVRSYYLRIAVHG